MRLSPGWATESYERRGHRQRRRLRRRDQDNNGRSLLGDFRRCARCLNPRWLGAPLRRLDRPGRVGAAIETDRPKRSATALAVTSSDAKAVKNEQLTCDRPRRRLWIEGEGRVRRVSSRTHEKQGGTRLGIVNRAINLAIQSTSDMVQHCASDVWSSPLATFRSGKWRLRRLCDCETCRPAARRRPCPRSPPRDRSQPQDRPSPRPLAGWLDDRWLVYDDRRFLLLDDRDIVTRYRPVLAVTLEPAAVKTYAQPQCLRSWPDRISNCAQAASQFVSVE